MGIFLFGNEMTFCNFNFFLNGISAQVDYLYAVTQGRLDMTDVVCGCNK